MSSDARLKRYADAMSGTVVWIGFRDDAGNDASAEGTVDSDGLRELAKCAIAIADAERREAAAEALERGE